MGDEINIWKERKYPTRTPPIHTCFRCLSKLVPSNPVSIVSLGTFVLSLEWSGSEWTLNEFEFDGLNEGIGNDWMIDDVLLWSINPHRHPNLAQCEGGTSLLPATQDRFSCRDAEVNMVDPSQGKSTRFDKHDPSCPPASESWLLPVERAAHAPRKCRRFHGKRLGRCCAITVNSCQQLPIPSTLLET